VRHHLIKFGTIERHIFIVEDNMTEELYLYDGISNRKAKLCICVECGAEWLIRKDRSNSGYCRKCLTKGVRNPMYGKAPYNIGTTSYDRNSLYAQRKRDIVAMFGNKCHMCKRENLPLGCFDFHHLVDNDKHTNIGTMMLWSWEKLKKELNKCIMVCSNCHREIHHGSDRLIIGHKGENNE